ncbi:MAG: hypothetical protein M0Q92_02285 [Methanoregula sp.]|jgi:hypothetical protein|nr:hypothetical protein [Methanoregula sp.]
MMMSVVTVRVMCPKCKRKYAEQYIPAAAIPEVTGTGHDYSDDCVVASCPACNHQVSVVVRMTDEMPGSRGTK